MKKRTMVKRVAAATMAGTMLMSMTAFAAGEVTASKDTAVITKKVTLPENVAVPKAEFTFEIQYPNSDSGTYEGNNSEGKAENTYWEKGVVGGLEFTNSGKVTFDGNETIESANDQFTAAEELGLRVIINENTFTKPGVYKYIIAEKSESYPGFTYSQAKYDVYVTIVTQNGVLVSEGVYCVKTQDDSATVVENGAKANEVEFTNDYDHIFDVTVTKKTQGNQVDPQGTFRFTVEVTADNVGDVFTFKDGGMNEVAIVPLVEGTTNKFSTTVTLTADESFTLYGLSANDSYTITEWEADSSEIGYKTYISEDTTMPSIEGTESRVITKTGLTQDMEYIVLNYKNAGAATGVAMTFAPYVLMLGAAGVAGGMFLRKKKEDF